MLAVFLFGTQARGQDYTRTPVLLVPGYGGSGASLSSMQSYLTGQGYPAEFVRTIDLVPGDGPNQAAAEQQIAPAVETFLSDVNDFLATTSYAGPPKTKIAILGWSMGGFSSRWYVTQVAPERIERWIGLAGANHGTQCACDLSCGIPAPSSHPNGLDDLCPPFSSNAAQTMQLTLNGPPAGSTDETPYGYGSDAAGKTSVPTDATRAIIYFAIHVGTETYILPNSSAEIDGGGGATVTLPSGSSAQETSPGNFLLPNDNHISVGGSADSFSLVLALLQAPLGGGPTNTPTDTPAVSPTPTITPATNCPPMPEASCRAAQKSLVFLKGGTGDPKGKLIWKWVTGASTSQMELADPTVSANYALCIYDANGLRLGARIPPDSTKWAVLGDHGYKYADPAGSADGIGKVLLKGSDDAKSKALVKGKGVNLPDPMLNGVPPPVSVQLRNQATGVCLGAVYGGGDVIKNDTGVFKAKTQ